MSLPEIIGGKYRPRHVLGAGSTGTVYSVEHTLTGQHLALKVMTSHLGGSPEAVARFKREALVLSKIRSPHVVRIFDADVAPELNGAPYLVMDLLEGVDLEKISEDKPIAPEAVVDWLRQVADPLDEAHRIGIIHRDLKPENLFLTHDEEGNAVIKILDFGIARVATEAMSVQSTQWGQLLGTPMYMAPEQARGDPTQVGPATDLYALGLIAYKLLSGTSYRTGTTLSVMLEEIIRGPLRAPSEVGGDFNPEFDCWFLRACHADPARRFASAEQQVEALARALDLPSPPEVTPLPSSGLRQSFTRGVQRDSLAPNADIVRISLNAMTGAEMTPTGGNSESTTVPSLLSTTFDTRRKRNGWRYAFFGLCGGVVVFLFTSVLLSRLNTPPVSPATAARDRIPLTAVPATALATPPVAPSTPALQAPWVATAPAPAANPAAAASAEKQVSRPIVAAPARALPARPWAPRPRAAVDDGPLSDQQ